MINSYHMRLRTSHQITHIEWYWMKYSSGNDGNYYNANMIKFDYDGYPR